MPRKKSYNKKVYTTEIINALRKEPFMSTNELANNLIMGYDTALKYLNLLLKEDKTKIKKVGNRRFWYIT